MRPARRAAAQRARRRHGNGQLRHRAGVGRVRSRPRRDRRPRGGGRCGRVSRLRPAGGRDRAAGGRRSAAAATASPARLGRPLASGTRSRHGSGAPVRVLAVGEPRARDPGRPLGRLAVPPEGVVEPAAPNGDDGHADLDRHARRLGLVRGRPALPRRGRAGRGDGLRARARPRHRGERALLRGCSGCDDASFSPGDTSRRARSAGPAPLCAPSSSSGRSRRA